VISALQEERNKLLAEKASWASSTSAPVITQDGGDGHALKQQLEAERSELQKARDDALAQAKVSWTDLTGSRILLMA
jgi:nucleoprotein TPR